MRVQVLMTTVAVMTAAATAAAQTPPVTLAAAEQTALHNHPQIQAAEFGAVAATQAVRESRAAYFPTVIGSISGAAAQSGSRIAAGGLNNPII